MRLKYYLIYFYLTLSTPIEMRKFFNILLEFNHKTFYSFIKSAIKTKKKGYVCVVDVNVLTMSYNDVEYQNVINKAFINTCDSSSIAMLANWIHNKEYEPLNGPEIFEYFIEKDYKHLLLGSTIETTDSIKEVLMHSDLNDISIQVITLPFKSVEKFNYQQIATKINKIKPDIIWVSLGAPKQEIFMNKLEPLIRQGVLFGIGAAFNFYIGKLNIPNFKIGSLRFIWLNRLFNEPIKIFKRLMPFILCLPALYGDEMKRKRNINDSQN